MDLSYEYSVVLMTYFWYIKTEKFKVASGGTGGCSPLPQSEAAVPYRPGEGEGALSPWLEIPGR
jgi:hypothetical protein